MRVRSVVKPVAVFLVWTLASFLCHKLAKLAMAPYVTEMTSLSPVVIPLVVTLVQVLCCYATVNVTSLRGPLFYVTVTSHFLATWATNTSLALTFASSALAVKMLEPMTSALLQRALLKTSLGVEGVAGMVVVVVGSVLYVGNPLSDRETWRAVLMALLSNLLLGVRNVALKLQDGAGSRRLHLRPASVLAASASCAALLLLLLSSRNAASGDFFSTQAPTYFVSLSLASGVFHVTYSYVSTNVVLRYMSVVSHALLNILKRVMVVLLLYVTGHRSASLWNWAGLVLCTVGLLMYSWKKIVTSSSPSSGSFLASQLESAEESRGEKEDGVKMGSASGRKAKGALLARLLVPLAFVFLVCVMSDQQISARTVPVQLRQQPGEYPRRLQQAALSQGGLQRGGFLQGFLQGGFPHGGYLKGLPQGFPQGGLTQGDFPQGDLPQGGFPQGGLPQQTELNGSEFVSKIFESNPKIPGNSTADYGQNLRFGHEMWTDGKPLLDGPLGYQPERKSVQEVEEYLSRENLLDTPYDTDGLLPYLTTSQAIIEETKRVQANLFGNLFRGKKYALAFQLAAHENKGDSALTIAELIMLNNMGIELLFFVNIWSCSPTLHKHALKLAQQHKQEEVVVLLHGGGNIFGYPQTDRCRDHVLRVFKGYQIVMFSQSVYLHATRSHFQFAWKNYCCNPNMTILLRDRLSLKIARRMFNQGTNLLLAPDMAFQIGHVDRYVPPYYDVIWQRRGDKENPLLGTIPKLPDNVTMKVWDWLHMPSSKAEGTVRVAMNIMLNGLGILQQGRVLVTDRLHGHILSTLLDIPHVLLDNCQQKLSSFHNTWTRGLKNCRLADNPEDAARYALELLEEYKDSLPKRLQAADIQEKL